jgi:hypothetical protein
MRTGFNGFGDVASAEVEDEPMASLYEEYEAFPERASVTAKHDAQ